MISLTRVEEGGMSSGTSAASLRRSTAYAPPYSAISTAIAAHSALTKASANQPSASEATPAARNGHAGSTRKAARAKSTARQIAVSNPPAHDAATKTTSADSRNGQSSTVVAESSTGR